MRIKYLLHPEIWIGCLLLIGLSLPFAWSDLDLKISALFFQNGWPIGDLLFWQWVYKFGPLPAILASLTGLGILIGACFWPALKLRRRSALLLVLTMLIGPGLLINLIGKQHWGRPRPRDVVQFGGQDTFYRFYQPGIPGGNSFPSGHSSMGFYFTAFYFILRKRRQQWLGLGVGLGYGCFIGLGRIAQGAHFASDVLFSGGLTYLTAALLYHGLLFPPGSMSGDQKARSQTQHNQKSQ